MRNLPADAYKFSDVVYPIFQTNNDYFEVQINTGVIIVTNSN
jgi:hypothetical protein